MQVCQAVEALAQTASPLVERVVRLRIGIVLSKDGGALQQMWLPFYCGLGGVVCLFLWNWFLKRSSRLALERNLFRGFTSLMPLG